jgi:hypothetical protein
MVVLAITVPRRGTIEEGHCVPERISEGTDIHMSTWVVFSNNNTNAGVGTGSATNVQAVGHLCVIVVQLVDPGAQGRDAHVRPPQGLQRRRQREWGGDHRPVPSHRALQLGRDAQTTTRATTCETWERKSVEKSGLKKTLQPQTTTLEKLDDMQ